MFVYMDVDGYKYRYDIDIGDIDRYRCWFEIEIQR